MDYSKQGILRSLPQVEEVLNHPLVSNLGNALPRSVIVETVRETLDGVRASILAQLDDSADATTFEHLASLTNKDTVATQVRTRALGLRQASLRPVVNASGVIIHTNLGRSVLPKSAVDAVTAVAGSYSTLEYDTEHLARGSRHDHCEQLICSLTGAEAAIAVNNNAAAVMMVLSEFAAGHEAIVSRGEQVEIGGSFRIPDIMAQSHATMVEVGATNKTHPADYQRAITDNTAMLLKVHTSNYRMIGFIESVSLKEMKQMAAAENERRRETGNDLDVIVYEDQGSGAFLRLACFGDYAEPTVAESVAQGVDLISFSGDKLLGGPQAGIIVGSKQYIDRLKKNPLARALRLDKMTLAALEATLRLYLDQELALREIPTLRMLSAAGEEMLPRAEALKQAIDTIIPADCLTASVVPEISRAGGGALPMCDIPTYAVSCTFHQGSALDCDRFLVSGKALPIVGRLKKDELLFDVRTLLRNDEFKEIVKGLSAYFASIGVDMHAAAQHAVATAANGTPREA